MNERVKRTLCYLLGKTGSKGAKGLLEGLPRDLQRQLDSEVASNTSGPSLIEAPQQRLQHLHHTWYREILQRLPSPLAEQAQAAMQAQQQGLTGRFWQYWMWRKLCEPQWLPAALLPADTFAEQLVALSKDQLVLLMDLLGVVDLVPTLKKVIQPTVRKQWLRALSPVQQRFLKQIMHEPVWIGSKELLGHAEASVADLNRLLHRRGCQRIGIALAHHHAGWLWRLAHKLDCGRGCVVVSAANPKVPLEASEISLKLVERCLAIMHDLQQPE